MTTTTKRKPTRQEIEIVVTIVLFFTIFTRTMSPQELTAKGWLLAVRS